MLVRLTVKLADLVNGIDLSHCAEGDVIDLTDREARILIEEGWAEEAPQETRITRTLMERGGVAADKSSRRDGPA
jgi:hypothetical protein